MANTKTPEASASAMSQALPDVSTMTLDQRMALMEQLTSVGKAESDPLWKQRKELMIQVHAVNQQLREQGESPGNVIIVVQDSDKDRIRKELGKGPVNGTVLCKAVGMGTSDDARSPQFNETIDEMVRDGEVKHNGKAGKLSRYILVNT